MQNNVNKSVFEYRGYKQYLAALVGNKNRRTGFRSKIAKVLRCQPTYVSQVLYGSSHFSLEQAEVLSEYLEHSGPEKNYFLLLLQRDRAGTESLQAFFQIQIEKCLENRMNLTERLGSKQVLSAELQSIYYSSWHYAAVHIALTIPSLRTIGALAEALRISKKRLYFVLEFLCSAGLAIETKGTYTIGKSQVRLGNSSHNIIKHHSHWRQQAVESLERESINDLHYSAVVSLSEKDLKVIKDQALQFIQESLRTIESSAEEKLYCLNVDFFDLARP